MKSINVDYNCTNIISTISGEAFYDSWDIFIRELLQNAYDACYTRRALEWSWGTEFLEMEEAEQVNSVRHGFDPKIVVSYNSSSGMLFVEDNGVGINENDLEKYIAGVGRSFYTSPEFTEQRLRYEPISCFGIGLCSCFRVSRAILIESKKDKSINTAWNVMNRQSLEPIAAKWFSGAQEIEYINSNRQLVGTRVTLALLPEYAAEMSMKRLVMAIQHYMAYQPIPVEVYYDKKKMILAQPAVEAGSTAYVVGITTLKVDTDLLEGYIVLYNSRHRELFGESELYQQYFRVTDHADWIGLKPEWLRYMFFRLNIKKKFLTPKINRSGVVADENLKKLREMIGQLVTGYYQKNPGGLSQYLSDGRENVISEYESELQLVGRALTVSVYLKGQELQLPLETVVNGFLGKNTRIAFIAHELFDYFRRQYPPEYEKFLEQYNLIFFEDNREFLMQFLLPYNQGQQYVITNLPGVIYTEMVADLYMRKNISPYRRRYERYPDEAVTESIFCYVTNEQSGPFRIILNPNHRNVQLLEMCQDEPRVSNLREVIIENIKQRIINSKNHWNRIIDFGGSFVEEWNSSTPMTMQSVWCLENDFADSINRFINAKFTESERIRIGIDRLTFRREDFISWWYMPRSSE
jgi:hypothetical protein